MALTIYSTPQCANCKLAKEFCKERHIEYREVDVANDQGKADEMMQKSGQNQTPVIIVPAEASCTHREEVVIGFNRERLTSLLGI